MADGAMRDQVVWQKFGLLMLGGALGALARYSLTSLTQLLLMRAGLHNKIWAIQWGTLVVNALGCLLFGVLWAVLVHRSAVSNVQRLGVFVGFLGAFTTFSTYAFETVEFSRTGHWGAAAGTVLAHNGLGLPAVWLGFHLGRVVGGHL